MKINDISRINAVQQYRQQHQSKTSTQSDIRSKRDEVQISSEAQQLLDMQAQSERSQRITELKQSVSTGTYSVDARQIAEKLLPYIQ